MNVARGDVVLVDFPFPSGAGSKVRPALVIQNDRGNTFDSVVNCVNLATFDKNRIHRKLGEMPDVLMRKIHDALKTALALP